jgi:hypothetical protein
VQFSKAFTSSVGLHTANVQSEGRSDPSSQKVTSLFDPVQLILFLFDVYGKSAPNDILSSLTVNPAHRECRARIPDQNARFRWYRYATVPFDSVPYAPVRTVPLLLTDL